MIGSTSEAVPLVGNPYVGPRPFEPGETLYGREDEITRLFYRWNAERIVLLHSPSGAGKSSLIQAGLLPRIRTSFDVWGPTRVNQEGPTNGANRYALSAMQGFEEGVPERLRRCPGELAGMTLSEYFEKRPRRRTAPQSVALLVDQFEEVLTADPLAVVAKHEFFDQLGELLHNPRIWALFVLREDYLAPLDPYARQVPTHLRNRFRIDLLALDAACQAMVEPAREGGREFPAAEQLVHDLALRKVQMPDGSFKEQPGHHVEPVQLQVVCRRLWNAMPADDLLIDTEDLEKFGSVNLALTDYYAESVTRIAGGDEALERAVREWFDERLITAGGVRMQVLRAPRASGGLANEAIGKLLDTHLVRAEQRAGATWYELAHDRLVGVVQCDNQSWQEEHLSEVQRRAGVWERQGQSPGLLVADQELAAAEHWAAGALVITDVEERFLDASREAQKVTDRSRRQTRRIRRLGIVAMIVGALAFVAGVVAVRKSREADRRRAQAEDLISFMLGDLQDKLTPIGRLDVLDSAGEKALAYFDSLEEGEITDSTQERYSKALNQIGHVRMAQGDLDGALSFFRRSLQETKALAARDPGNLQWQFSLGQSHFWVGAVFLRMKYLDPALAEMHAYLDTSLALAENDPRNSDWVLEVAYGYTSVADVLTKRGDELDRAREHYWKALEISRGLVALDPTRTDWRNRLATGNVKFGKWIEKYGADLHEALSYYKEGVVEFQTLLVQDPVNTTRKRQLVAAYDNAAAVAIHIGDLEYAMSCLRPQEAHCKALLRLDSTNVEWQILCRSGEYNMSVILSLQGATEEALERLRGLLRTEERLLGATGTAEVRHVRIMALNLLGRIFLERNEYVQANEVVRAAIAELEGIAADWSHDGKVCAMLSKSYLLVGDIMAATGRKADATDAWTKAVDAIDGFARGSSYHLYLDPWVRSFMALERVDAVEPYCIRLLQDGYRGRGFVTACARHGWYVNG